jgi:hypothetical protein
MLLGLIEGPLVTVEFFDEHWQASLFEPSRTYKERLNGSTLRIHTGGAFHFRK